MTCCWAARNSFSIASSASPLLAEKRGGHVGGGEIAAGDHLGELLDRPRGLHGVVPGQIRRTEDGVDLGLGVHHGRAGGGDEGGLRAAQRGVLPVMLGSKVEPLARRGAEAVDVVVDVLHGLAECRDDGLVGAEFNDLAELLRS